MCLSIPAKIVSINDNKAEVSVGGVVYEASLELVEDVCVGDYVLLHTGFALQKIDQKEAEEMMKILDELRDDENNN